MLHPLSSKTSSHMIRMLSFRIYGFIESKMEKMWKDGLIIIVGWIPRKAGNYLTSWIVILLLWKGIRVILTRGGSIWQRWEVGETIHGKKYILTESEE